MTDAAITTGQKQHRTMHHALVLGLIATLSGALVVVGNLETRNVIIQRHKEDMVASLSQVINPDMYDNKILKDTLSLKYNGADKKIFRARKNGKIVAVAFSMTTIGYSGPIKLIMGINSKGVLLGVRILSHTETPGLGDRIEAKKSKWIFSFDNMSFAKLKPSLWKVKKDKGYFDQFTGATITPRAVVKGIKAGMDLFTDHKAEILAQQQQPENSTDTAKPAVKPSVKERPDNTIKTPTEVNHHA